MFSAGNILHITDFKFPNGDVKSKFMIVLCNHEGKFVVSTLTSSQVYINTCDMTEGCIKTDVKHCYYFPQGKLIGKNGFSFVKDTFVYFTSNIRKLSIEELNIYLPDDIAVVSKLTKEEYIDVLYCSYKGEFLSKRISILLETELQKLLP